MFWRMTLTTLVAYPVTFLVVRFLGKKQISTMTFWDMVSAIALGSLAANMIANVRDPLYATSWAVVLWGGLSLATGWVSLRSRKARSVLQGMPALIIANGHVLEDVMRRERLNMDLLLSELRTQGVASIRDVEFAVFEPTGKVSVLKKSQSSPVTPKDLNLPTSPNLLSTALIMEGTTLSANLNRAGRDVAWLREQLAEAGIPDQSQVFYAELGPEGKLYIDRYGDNVPTHWQQH